jgi:hypothetical protein
MAAHMSMADELRALEGGTLGLGWRHLFELASVLDGRRPVARVVVGLAEIDALHRALLRLGLHTGRPLVANRPVRRCGDDRFCHRIPIEDANASTDSAAVVIARDAPAASEGQRIDDFADSSEIGRMLGYPDCCVEGYRRIEAGTEWTALLASQSHRVPSSLAAECNCLAGLFDHRSLHPDYFPCILGCAAAERFNRSLVDAGRACGLLREAADGRAAMCGPVAVLDGATVRLASTGDGLQPRDLVLRGSVDERWREVLTDPLARFHRVARGVVVEIPAAAPLAVGGTIVEFL